MTRKGVWNLQQVRDKQLQSLWAQTYTLFSWGLNDDKGGLGHNNITAVSSPKQVGSASSWYSVTAGKAGTFLGTKEDGTLWVCGGGAPSNGNQYGGLGLNSTAGFSSPVQVPGTTWDVVGSSNGFSVATKTDGSLWSWGYNTYGVLGQNNTTNYSSPVQLGSDTTWTSEFSVSNNSMIAIKSDNTMWAWGYNGSGKLGQGNKTTYSSPKQIPGSWSKCSTADQIVMAVNTSGSLFTWGGNSNTGALGHNNETDYSSPKEVPGGTWAIPMAGQDQWGCIKTDGTLYMNGKQEDAGSLAINDKVNRSSPVQVPGTTWGNIYSIMGNGSPSGHWLATKTDGSLWSWGQNTSGSLGQNNKTKYSSPVQVGSNTNWATGRHSAAISPDVAFALTQTLTPSQL